MGLFLKGILIGLLFGVPVGAVGGIRLLFRKGEAAEIPAAMLTFLFAFSWFGIVGGSTLENGCLVVLGVFIGTYLWWGGAYS